MPTGVAATENSGALAASACVVMVKTPLACDMLASVAVFSSMADALPNVIVTCCVNSASVSTFVAVMFTEANLLELSAPYCLAKTSFVTNLSPSTENYWCPLNFKRHDKTLRNASKHGVADSFFKTKPPLIK